MLLLLDVDVTAAIGAAIRCREMLVLVLVVSRRRLVQLFSLDGRNGGRVVVVTLLLLLLLKLELLLLLKLELLLLLLKLGLLLGLLLLNLLHL